MQKLLPAHGWLLFTPAELAVSDTLFLAAVVAGHVLVWERMSDKVEALKRRTKRFALDVLDFVGPSPRTDNSQHIRWQLTRSATSVGANYRAACRARSRAEFIAKVGIALEEADESAFWLEILTESRMDPSDRAADLLREANELSAIFAASCITARANASLTHR